MDGEQNGTQTQQIEQQQENQASNNKREHDDDDGGAGDDVHQLDMIELTIVPC